MVFVPGFHLLIISFFFSFLVGGDGACEVLAVSALCCVVWERAVDVNGQQVKIQ